MNHRAIITLGRKSGIRAAKRHVAFWGSEASAHPRDVDSFVDAAISDLGRALPGFFGFDFAETREAIALHVLAARSVTR